MRQLSKSHKQAIGKNIHIRNDAADQITGGMRIQIRERELLDLPDGGVPQISGYAEGDAIVACGENPLGDGRNRNDDRNGNGKPQDGGKIHLSPADHIVDGIPAEDGDDQLGGHADGGAEKAGKDEEAIGLDIEENTLERPALEGSCRFFIRFFHCLASPFWNWLS